MASTLLQTISNFETTISAKLTASGASLVLTTNLDKQGNALPSGVYGFTLDEGKSNEEHIIGTLSGSMLTITTRNVSLQDGTTGGTGKEHRKGASIKITNHPLMVRMRRLLDGTDGFNGAQPVHYDTSPTFTPGSNQFVTVAYADVLVGAGVADATDSSKGKVKLSVAATDVANPIAVGDNDTRIPTQGENDALVGTSGTPSSTNKFVTNADTTGTGSVSRTSYVDTAATKKVYANLSQVANSGGTLNSETTIYTTTINANTLGTANGLLIKVPISTLLGQTTTGNGRIKIYYGSTAIITISSINLKSATVAGMLEVSLFANASTSSQKAIANLTLIDDSYNTASSTATVVPRYVKVVTGTASIDSTANQTLSMTFQDTAGSGQMSLTTEAFIVTLIK